MFITNDVGSINPETKKKHIKFTHFDNILTYKFTCETK